MHLLAGALISYQYAPQQRVERVEILFKGSAFCGNGYFNGANKCGKVSNSAFLNFQNTWHIPRKGSAVGLVPPSFYEMGILPPIILFPKSTLLHCIDVHH